MSMRICKNTEIEEKTLKLCSGFSLLDEKDQEYMFGILQALLFAVLKMEAANDVSRKDKK